MPKKLIEKLPFVGVDFEQVSRAPSAASLLKMKMKMKI